MNLKLIRVEKSSDGVRGVLLLDGSIFAVTLEPENYIPSGFYKCKRYHSLKFPETYVVLDVPNRKYILFHAGNVEEDTSGCILIAENFGKLRGKRAILNSGQTFKKFLSVTAPYDILDLEIVEVL